LSLTCVEFVFDLQFSNKNMTPVLATRETATDTPYKVSPLDDVTRMSITTWNLQILEPTLLVNSLRDYWMLYFLFCSSKKFQSYCVNNK